MGYSYLITPFLTWLVAGILKFIINTIKSKKLAFGLIGYGGLPSNHSAIVSSMVVLIALKQGFNNPSFGVAIALAFIVMLDANSLRRQVGKHAQVINKLTEHLNDKVTLRERMGHSRIEIGAGIIVGSLVAFTVNSIGL